MVTSLVVFLIYNQVTYGIAIRMAVLSMRWISTKPLSKIIEYLVSTNSDRPGQDKLPLFKGYEHNELWLWIKTAHQLLASIENNSYPRRKAEDNLLRVSQYDLLTSLPNHQLLQQQLNQTLNTASRQKRYFGLDLDDFKSTNEQYLPVLPQPRLTLNSPGVEHPRQPGSTVRDRPA